METFNRSCLIDKVLEDKEGKYLTLKKGEEYLTSRAKKGVLTVFSSYWVRVDSSWFGRPRRFTI